MFRKNKLLRLNLDGNFTDFIYGYGESNSLAFEAFRLLHYDKHLITAAESLDSRFISAILLIFRGLMYLKVDLLLSIALKKAKMLDIPLSQLEGVVSHFLLQKNA